MLLLLLLLNYCISQSFAPCKEIRIPEAVKFLLVESQILGFAFRNTAQGIQNPTNDWNPEPKTGIQHPESGIKNPSLPWFPYMGRNHRETNACISTVKVKVKVLILRG